MLFQTNPPDNNYLPQNQTGGMGNDDQGKQEEKENLTFLTF